MVHIQFCTNFENYKTAINETKNQIGTNCKYCTIFPYIFQEYILNRFFYFLFSESHNCIHTRILIAGKYYN